MALTANQEAALADVKDFLADPNQKFFNISGKAGSGKTYLINYLITQILKKNKIRYAIAATTNKAASVIRDDLSTGDDVDTVHSFLNLRVQNDFKTGTVSCKPTHKWQVYEDLVLIVDEASMVDQDLFHYINLGLGRNCKVIFVGDKNQLNPVGESSSQVYNSAFPTTYLIEPIRNANSNALMDLCEQAKTTILTGVFEPIKEVPGVIDYLSGPQLKGILEREYTIESDARRLLTYTNARTKAYNHHIRNLRGYTAPYTVGEILVNNSPVKVSYPKDKVLYADQSFIVCAVDGPKEEQHLFYEDAPASAIYTITLEDIHTGATYTTRCFGDDDHLKTILKNYAQKKNWKNHFHYKETYPDLRPYACSTVHKSQGSTFESVIIDLNDIAKCTKKTETARLLYVAVSRATDRVFLRGQLPDRYFT